MGTRVDVAGGDRIGDDRELLGPLPPAVQDFTVFTTSVGANAKEPEAGGVLIKFLTAPSAASVIKAKGMEPAR
jgi:molybdate transport system substrate-binding protein